jgi:hypothetical protein
MRILLDECVPRPLRNELPGHEVRTVAELGWSGKRNGELLSLMKANGFDVFVTVDQNVPYQQNLGAANVAVIVLKGVSNRMPDLLPLMKSVHSVLNTIAPGDVVEVS